LRRILISLMLLFCVGCSGGSGGQPTPEPLSLLTEAANNIRARNTFRLYVEQTGAKYEIPIIIALGQDPVNVEFRFARAQYVSPDMLQATARVVVPLMGQSLAQEFDIFSKGADQWYRAIGTAWIKGDFAPGFNPTTLIAEDSGFQAALTALTDLEYIGEETLEDGTPVYHLRGVASGPSVSALVVGLIQTESDLPVDVYINRDTRLPARIILRQPETVSEEEPEPTTWTIDVYDVDEPSELTPPEEVAQR
jgi:hypothetical protein